MDIGFCSNLHHQFLFAEYGSTNNPNGNCVRRLDRHWCSRNRPYRYLRIQRTAQLLATFLPFHPHRLHHRFEIRICEVENFRIVETQNLASLHNILKNRIFLAPLGRGVILNLFHPTISNIGLTPYVGIVRLFRAFRSEFDTPYIGDVSML